MKFNKNQDKSMSSFLRVQDMQNQLVSVAVANDIVTSTTIDFDKDGNPFLKYKVFFTPTQIAFEGDTRLDHRPYLYALDAICGRLVSILFPPAKKHVEIEDQVIAISHWRRVVLSEEDVTAHVKVEHGASPADYGKNRKKVSNWIGFDADDQEICRINDGTTNEGHKSVVRVRYEDNYNYGMVVFVDHDVPYYGESATYRFPSPPNASQERRELMRESKKDPARIQLESQILKVLNESPTTPPIITREQFDAKPEDYQVEYVGVFMQIVSILQKVWEDKLDVEIPERFIQYVKDFVNSDIAEKEWKELYFDSNRAESVPLVPTLLSFTMGKFKVSVLVREKLFGDYCAFLTEEEKKAQEKPVVQESNTFSFGTLTGVLPKVMTKEEYSKATEGEKAEYLNHVNAIVKLFSKERKNLKEEQPDTFEKLKDFLKEVIQSCIFEHMWRDGVVASFGEDYVLTCDAFTAKAVGMSEEVFAETYGARCVFLTKKMAAMIRGRIKSEQSRGDVKKAAAGVKNESKPAVRAVKEKQKPASRKKDVEQKPGSIAEETTNSKK